MDPNSSGYVENFAGDGYWRYEYVTNKGVSQVSKCGKHALISRMHSILLHDIRVVSNLKLITVIIKIKRPASKKRAYSIPIPNKVIFVGNQELRKKQNLLIGCYSYNSFTDNCLST